jgi:hypothetical protein
MKCKSSGKRGYCRNKAMSNYRFCRYHAPKFDGLCFHFGQPHIGLFRITIITDEFIEGSSIQWLAAIYGISVEKVNDILRFEMKARRPL